MDDVYLGMSGRCWTGGMYVQATEIFAELDGISNWDVTEVLVSEGWDCQSVDHDK